MKIQKFAKYDKRTGKIEEKKSLIEWINGLNLHKDSAQCVFLQYLGFEDHNGTEIYEGDVLKLEITEDLMDPHKESFYNSNFGKYIKREKEENGVQITAAFVSFAYDQKMLQPVATVYLAKDGLIERDNDGDLKVECVDTDQFAAYLCNKGAVVVGNLLENPKLLENEAVAIKDMKNVSRFGDYLFLKDGPCDNYNVFRQDGTAIASVETIKFDQAISCRYFDDGAFECYKEPLDVDKHNCAADPKERDKHLANIAEILVQKEKEGELLNKMKGGACYDGYYFVNTGRDNYDVFKMSNEGKPCNVAFVETSRLAGSVVFCRRYKDAVGMLYPSCYKSPVFLNSNDQFLKDSDRLYHLKQIAKVLLQKEKEDIAQEPEPSDEERE